jgi:Gluconate 2-dehydrogenase subunit 3
MSDVTRRELFQRLAITIAAAGTIDRVVAQDVHHLVMQATPAGAGYAPKALTPHEFQILERLTDLIIPAEGTKPGAVQCDVAAWIDTLLNVNDELKRRYSSGLAWLDSTMRQRGAADFVTATAEQQTALLDVIAYRKNTSPELDPGIEFFTLARRMTADGFYTHPVGMKDVYQGNSPQAAFTVPQAAIDHVISRSPFK